MSIFEFTDNLKADLARFRTELKSAERRNDRVNADVETKRAADVEIARRIHAFAADHDIDFSAAATKFFARATSDPQSDDAALICISVAGVLTMTANPAVRG